ncbi:MAG: hypothetical protein KGZ85_03850 [Ignavibacterium sp.]|nr:hypothetical protein [Ignavibacterium sp.]
MNKSDFKINITEINSWLNLMPGGPGSFHLSGELEIHSDPESMINDISIKEIVVYTGKQLLYGFKPVFQYSRTEPDFSLNNKKIEVYQFFTEKGLEIREVLMGNNLINVELTLVIDDKELVEKLKDIEVTRAY